MPIKKNFKIISEDKEDFQKEQADILLSPEEKEKIEGTITDFFSSIKTLLREGAVLIDTEASEGVEEKDLEETFLHNPTLKNEKIKLHTLALKALPKEKSEAILSKIGSVKMSEDYDFSIESKENSDVINFVSEKISNNLKEYSKELPAIMQERAQKLKLLVEARPDIKKYLENKN